MDGRPLLLDSLQGLQAPWLQSNSSACSRHTKSAAWWPAAATLPCSVLLSRNCLLAMQLMWVVGQSAPTCLCKAASLDTRQDSRISYSLDHLPIEVC